MKKNVSLLLIATLIGLTSIACDDSTTQPDESNLSEFQLIFDLDAKSKNEFNDSGELSFPLPNDAVFSSTKTWALKDTLNHSSVLSSWREQVSLLGGAPLYPIISAPLSHSVDIGDLLLRQNNDSFLDDAIYLLCLSEQCEGELVPLDFGLLPDSFGLFNELNALAENSPYPSPELLGPLSAPLSPQFEQNPKLTDLKSLLEQYSGEVKSLIWQADRQQVGNLLLSEAPSLGEQAQVLNFRPQSPLKPNSEYAVILTKALRSSEGVLSTKVKGYFPTELAKKRSKLESLMQAFKQDPNVFSSFWTFTTGDPMALKSALRQAITQKSSTRAQELPTIAQKSALFRNGVYAVHNWSNVDSESACEARGGLDCRVDLEQLALPDKGVRALALAWAESQGNHVNQLNALYQSYEAVKGLFSGEINTWYVSDWQGASNAEGLKLQEQKRPFWCVIPNSGNYIDRQLDPQTRQAPFPVILWSDDSGQERLNLLLWAGYFARAGFASCAIETVLGEQILEPEFNLALGIKWRDYGFSNNLAQSILESNFNALLLQDVDLADVNRPLNRALTQQQFTWWLSQASTSVLDQEFDTLKSLTLLPHEEIDRSSSSSEYPLGALVYAGEGEGASAAMISGVMDELASAVVSVDLSADLSHQQVIGIGRGGADQFLNRDLGPWLIWDQEQEAWRWTADSQGMTPIQVQDVENNRPELLSVYQENQLNPENLNGKWLALYNQNLDLLGERKLVNAEQIPILTVPSLAGDLLSVQVFSSLESSEPDAVSDRYLLAPYSGSGALPGSESARTRWRLNQWDNAIDDPLELSAWVSGGSESVDRELRSLLLAHPRSIDKPLSASLRMSEHLGLGFDQNRSDLYGLNAKDFLILSQAYEASRAWGLPWMDWDDLDVLEIMTPAFTRNVQLSLQRPSFSGGYHALKMPWRLKQSSGLALPEDPEESLETLSLNLITRFVYGLSYNASAEELTDLCLNQLAPSLKACSFLSVTNDELEALGSEE